MNTPISPTSKAIGPEAATLVSPSGKGERVDSFEGRPLEIGCCCCNPFKGVVQTLLDGLPDVSEGRVVWVGKAWCRHCLTASRT